MSVSTITIAAILTATGPIPVGDPLVLPDRVELAGSSSSQPTVDSGEPGASGGGTPAGVGQAPESGAIGNVPEPAGPPVAGGDAGQPARKEILVEGEAGPPPGDPLAQVNAQTFEVVQVVDKVLVEPVARGYMNVVPKPLRDGVHNVVNNLDEPVVFLSFLLQFKFGKALETLGRFGINSTIGLGGLIDVAKNKPFNQPHQVNSLGHTLAYYGVGSGPFLYLPIIGSTTLRDLVGQLAAMPILPLTVGKPFNDPAYVIPKAVLTGIDQRVEDDDRIKSIKGQSSNPYAIYRSYYLRKRQAEVDVLRGKRDNAEVPVFEDEAPASDSEAAPPVSAAPAADEQSFVENPHVPVDDGAVLAE